MLLFAKVTYAVNSRCVCVSPNFNSFNKLWLHVLNLQNVFLSYNGKKQKKFSNLNSFLKIRYNVHLLDWFIPSCQSCLYYSYSRCLMTRCKWYSLPLLFLGITKILEIPVWSSICLTVCNHLADYVLIFGKSNKVNYISGFDKLLSSFDTISHQNEIILVLINTESGKRSVSPSTIQPCVGRLWPNNTTHTLYI